MKKRFLTVCILIAAIILSIMFLPSCSEQETIASGDEQKTVDEDNINTGGIETDKNENEDDETETPTNFVFTPITGWNMMAEMGIGINIGNTLEARGYGRQQTLDTETWWGAERIAKWHFESIAQKGLKSVRLPISWEPHMDETTGAIDVEWMDRVQECVDWALECGLYVVINTHHEHGLYDFFADGNGWTEDREGALAWLKNVWGQIAERFKDYPETLIFEPMNEPKPGESDGTDKWYWDVRGQASGIERVNRMVNWLNHEILGFIRNTGGNNDKRVVALTIIQADAKVLDQYDHTFDDPYTMVGVFFYKGDEQMQLDGIKWAIEQKIPVILKETMPIGEENETRALAWSENWYGKLAELGAVPMWWNCYGQPPTELFDRWTGWWNDPMVDAVFNAYGKTPGSSIEPPPRDYFDDRGFQDEGDGFWFGGQKLRDAMIEHKYLLVEVDVDELRFVVHSGAEGYTRDEIEGIRVDGTNWWYLETHPVIEKHLGAMEEIGWWFQVQMICEIDPDNGIPNAMMSDTLP